MLVLQQFFKIADRINEGEHWLGDTFGPFHKSVGAVILIRVTARLIWAGSQETQMLNRMVSSVISPESLTS